MQERVPFSPYPHQHCYLLPFFLLYETSISFGEKSRRLMQERKEQKQYVQINTTDIKNDF